MPSDQLNDQELQFKKRARRRLVGAIALVLLMITILPMVLDDRSAKTPAQEIAITIPSQEGEEFTSKVIPVPAQVLPKDTQSPANTHEAEPAVAVPNVSLENPIKPVTDLPEHAVTEAVTAVSPEVVKPDTKQAVAVEKATEHKVAPVVEVATPKSAQAKDVKPVTQSGLFSVQIGVFSDVENVKKIQQKIAGKGLKSYTEKLETPKGEKIRLRVGPFKNRPDAEAAALKVKELELAAMVVSNK